VGRHQTLPLPAVLEPADSTSDSIPWVSPLFEPCWWLERFPRIIQGAVVRRGEEAAARLPVHASGTMIVQPPCTQTLRPWLAPMEDNRPRRLETEKRLMGQLIEDLPPCDFFLPGQPGHRCG